MWLARFSCHRGISLGLVAAIAVTDQSIRWAQMGFLPRALIDEPCHLATAVIVLGTLTRVRGRPPTGPFIAAMLSSSVLIDVDHLPRQLGYTWWTAGTPRPYTHALWVVAGLAMLAVGARRRYRVSGGATASLVTVLSAGAAWGVAVHFLRDVASAQVALWWPVSSAGVHVPYHWYLLTLLALAAVPWPRRGERGGTRPGEGQQDQLSRPGRGAVGTSR